MRPAIPAGRMTGADRIGLRATADGDDRLAAIYRRVERAVGTIPTMYQTLAHSPEILDGWIGLGWSLRSAAGPARGLHELAILRVAQLTGSEYVWRSHRGLAVEAGIDGEKLAGLDEWRGDDRYSGTERVVLELTDALTERAAVDDAIWARAAALFDERDLVGLVMAVSWYCCVARVAAGLAVPLEDRHADVPGLGS